MGETTRQAAGRLKRWLDRHPKRPTSDDRDPVEHDPTERNAIYDEIAAHLKGDQ